MQTSEADQSVDPRTAQQVELKKKYRTDAAPDPRTRWARLQQKGQRSRNGSGN